MIPVLYPSTETSFTTNGLGGLPDAISCVVTEQRNTQGGYYLEMEYPVDGLHFDLLAPERIIYAAPSMGNTPQPFRISRITRPINGIVHIEAPHLCAELQKLTSWGVDTGTNIQGMIYNQFYRARQLGQTVPFWCETDITVESDVTFSHPEPTSLADILLGAEGSVLDVVGGEYEWDGYHILLHRQRGVDSGLEIRYGVNMSDLEAETDATELVTAVVPFWKGTVNDVETVVIGDMCSASNASAYAYVRCVPLDVTQQFEETDTQPTKAQVTAKGQAFIDGTSRRLLQTSIRVSYEPTTSGIGERLINLCDTVRVVYPDLNVSSISKVVETRFNVLTERYDELTIGTIRNNIVDTIAGLISGSASGGGGSSGGGGGSSAVTSVNGMTGDVVLNAASVGALPSTYTAPVTSVNGMTGDVVVSGGGGAVDSVNGQTGVVVLTASDVGAVATESGKGLSTNDFTTAEKNKLSGIESGAEVNVQADWNQTDSSADDFIKNKPTNMLPSYTSNDAWKKLRVNYNGSALEWAAESGDHTIFYINESTLALDNGAKGSDITQALLSDFKSVYIIGNESYSDGVKFNIYLPLNDDAPTRDIESVSFYRPTTNGIVVLNILAGQSVATKTTISFNSGSGNFVKITYNSNTAAVTHNGTAITGSQIKTLLDQNDSGAIMVDTNGSPNAVYRLKNIYSDGQVEFEGEIGDNIINVIVPANGSTGNATVSRKPQVYYYLDGTTVKSAQTNFAVTGQQIQTATIDNGLAPIIYKYESSDYITYEYHFFSFHSGGMNFRTLDGKKLIFVPWNSSTATLTQSAGYSANIVFYLDGTTVKYSGTNTAVTGADVHAISLAVGIMPVIRQTSNGVDRFFHLDRTHSGGLEFRLLDGTKKLVLNFNSSTAVITNL